MGRRTADDARPVVLPRSRAEPDALVVDDAVLLAALTAVAGAEGLAGTAAAVLAPLRRLPSVRAAAVARAARAGADLVVVASDGYDCASMGAGTRLPRDAGLPVTECVRTGRTQVTGTGPAWVAVPAGPDAALLLSLTGPPPPEEQLARVEQLGTVLGAGLQRAVRAEATRTGLLVLEEGLAAPAADGDGLVVRSAPFTAPLGGDVVELVGDGGVRWLLVADVCGRGPGAAVSADRLRAAFRACAPGAAGPVEVLARLDRALRGGEEDFATALVLRVQEGRVRLAGAGHPAPLRVPGGPLDVVAAPPLGLGLDGPWPGTRETAAVLPGGSLLLLTTDGVTDRGHEVDLEAVVAALPAALPAPAVADAVLSACDAAGPAQDDVTLAVLTV